MANQFPYKKILMIGGTSGLGSAWAKLFIHEGYPTIVVGRRQQNLDDFVKANGDKAFSSQFDITNLKEIPNWVGKITEEHPDIDCVFLNAGIQRVYNWAKPETVNLYTIDTELTTNYTAYIHLTKALLPHLMKVGESGLPTALVGVTSGLGLVPLTRSSNYSATKAALHAFFLTLRAQLADADAKVKIIEVLPPAVQTELHDAKHQPELGIDGSKMGLPLDKFIEESWRKLQAGEEELFFEGFEAYYCEGGFEAQRQQAFKRMHNFSKKLPLNF